MAQTLQLAYWSQLAMMSNQIPYSNMMLMQNPVELKRVNNSSAPSTSPQLQYDERVCCSKEQ